jgi:hypothetical protein
MPTQVIISTYLHDMLSTWAKHDSTIMTHEELVTQGRDGSPVIPNPTTKCTECFLLYDPISCDATF